ncbi:glycerophosphodiester phosphodiesterase [Rhodospirillum rubrum]|uniref:glycerophosphodiester phosphodiesterase family protein n=1 Tax=Rhodospirillum rubrum TaxID=1085 RepID=UPI001906F1CF|nr:glycerophosphodiester phosphodiesterase family protein [Rhodospirillum rubrum]MBK1665328.1 glycerophosphodiester phosphodiesterase [Rhodospirillum rubrum]MBK1676516.1 glycerophosphodiester phosphodiesterase [Rhodospirillum rubrum]
MTSFRPLFVLSLVLAGLPLTLPASAAENDPAVQLGPRPFYLVDAMAPGALKDKLESCKTGPFYKSTFSIGHRGAPLQFPEHTRESYVAAARMGAGIVECDVTFTKDRQLVCRHSQCDLHTTTDILAHPDLAQKCTEPFTPADAASGKKASAKCCTSDITLAEFKTLSGKMDASDPTATTIAAYMAATPKWRTDLYATHGTLMTHAESIALFKSLGVGFTPELKSPSVAMPFEGSYSQSDYASQMITDYSAAGIDPAQVHAQSFDENDVYFWAEKFPDFARNAVYLDDRDETKGFSPMDPASWSPTMEELVAKGVKVIGPPLWYLVTLDADNRIVPSVYAQRAREAGLAIVTWSLERSGPLATGGGWYYSSITKAVNSDGAMMTLLDVLAKDVGVIGVFSDWPATTTYYASCMGLK